jgi:hypothetical protein
VGLVDLQISLVVLKGLGSLPGSAPTVGVTDPESLREDDELSRAERERARSMRRLLSTSW